MEKRCGVEEHLDSYCMNINLNKFLNMHMLNVKIENINVLLKVTEKTKKEAR